MTEDVETTENAEAAPAGDTTNGDNPGFLGTTWNGITWLLWRHLAYVGLVGALVFFLLSLTPSLLPRGVFFAGVVGGAAAAAGYGIGSLVSALLRMFVDEPSETTKKWA